MERMTKTQSRFKTLLWNRWTDLLREMQEHGGDDEQVARFCTAFYTYCAYLRRVGINPLVNSPYHFLYLNGILP